MAYTVVRFNKQDDADLLLSGEVNILTRGEIKLVVVGELTSKSIVVFKRNDHHPKDEYPELVILSEIASQLGNKEKFSEEISKYTLDISIPELEERLKDIEVAIRVIRG